MKVQSSMHCLILISFSLPGSSARKDHSCCPYCSLPVSIPLQEQVTLFSHQFSSVTQSCPTFCHLMNHSTPGVPVQHQLPEFSQTHVFESVMPSSHLILCRPLLYLPSIFPSIRVCSIAMLLLLSHFSRVRLCATP